MRLLRIGMVLSLALGVVGIDAGELARSGTLTIASAQAKHRRRRHHRKRHHRRHRRKAPATEM